MTPTMIANLLQVRKVELDKKYAGMTEGDQSYDTWFAEYLRNGNLEKFREVMDAHPEIIQKLVTKNSLSSSDLNEAIVSLGF